MNNRAAYLREWRAKNAARVAAYRADTREKRNAQWRERYKGLDKAQRAAVKAEWHKPNRERVLEAKRLMRAENPGWNTAANAKRRAIKAGTRADRISYKRVLANAGGVCGICRLTLNGDIHFDHIVPLARGGTHTESNLQAAHAACNRRKHAKVA